MTLTLDFQGQKFWNSCILGIGGLERKCIDWMLGQLCDLNLWPHACLWLEIFKVKFWNSFISGIRSLIYVKWKEVNRLDAGLSMWPWPLTLNNCMLGIGGLIDLERKGWESIIHDCDLWMTMVCVGVLDSDRSPETVYSLSWESLNW